MRAMAVLIFGVVLLPGGAAHAAPTEGPPGFWEVYQPGPNGLPLIPISGQQFKFDGVTQKFTPSFSGEYHQVYIVWWKNWHDYGWVTANDTRRMLSGSKLQGYRVGANAENALEWFQLGDGANSLVWKKVRDRGAPKVYREDPVTKARVISESAPAEWTTWGGSLDPVPEGDVSCSIKATPESPKVGEKVRFDIETKGNATALKMDGQELLLPNDFVEKTFDRAGIYDVAASVGRGPTRNGCRASVKVLGRTAAEEDFGCSVLVEPAQLTVGQVGRVMIRTFGNVNRLEYLKVPLPVGAPVYRAVVTTKAGNFAASARVLSDGKEKTCQMPFTVTANASER